jgi:hypothetical protein
MEFDIAFRFGHLIVRIPNDLVGPELDVRWDVGVILFLLIEPDANRLGGTLGPLVNLEAGAVRAV